MDVFHLIVKRRATPVKRVLEVGGAVGPNSLLNFPELAGAEKFSVNLEPFPSIDGITALQANGNDMSMFESESFDLVMSNATLEHDKYFWLTVAEMKRVLQPRGLLVIGVPGFVLDEENDVGNKTVTFRRHTKRDYWRFSPQAVRDVFFEGMERVKVRRVLDPVRLIGRGRKPAI